MKTKLLIELLQKADPSGEEHVCINNQDIAMIYKDAADYDGVLQVLEWDESHRKVIGASYVRDGYKIQITPMSIADVIRNESLDIKVKGEEDDARSN